MKKTEKPRITTTVTMPIDVVQFNDFVFHIRPYKSHDYLARVEFSKNQVTVTEGVTRSSGVNIPYETTREFARGKHDSFTPETAVHFYRAFLDGIMESIFEARN